jgi:hypothetical protein
LGRQSQGVADCQADIFGSQIDGQDADVFSHWLILGCRFAKCPEAGRS